MLIEIRKAKEHNLKSIDIDLPRDSFVVITGVSGSGKSSLAFDTIFQEGQRRYIESLSAYARQFIGTMKRPDAESIKGISPTISIDQKTINRNPRSTVGTVVEIFDHYRLLFARLGIPHCPKCGKEIKAQTAEQIADTIFLERTGQQAIIMAPIVRERKGEYRKEIAELKEKGFAKARIDGEMYNLNGEIPELARYEKHSIDVVIDKILIEPKNRTRLMEALEQAFKINKDKLVSFMFEDYVIMSANLACAKCGISLPEIEPRLFSFNDKQGQCPTCKGLGKNYQIDASKLINPELSIEEGAILASTADGRLIFSNIGLAEYRAIAKNLSVPWKNLAKKAQNAILELISSTLQGLWDQWHIHLLQKYMLIEPCKECNGERICATARAMKFHGKGISEISALSVDESIKFFEKLKLSEKEARVGREIFREIKGRLGFLQKVGLGYLTLDRRSATLSGGEAQRIRLAGHIGAGLQGVLYVLDEPSIGLHAKDNEQLLDILEKLKSQGNSLIVVEHDEETIRRADCIADIGPGAGSEGGQVVALGKIEDLKKNPSSITGAYLNGKKRIEMPECRRKISKTTPKIKIIGAKANNLKNINVGIPVGVFTAVTGVSGSGKSSLINHILKKALAKKFHGASEEPGKHKTIEGLENIDKVIEIDQSPIGRTPRSNPATYTKIYDDIRNLFASLTESRINGFTKSRFSFNVHGGRCEKCCGAGVIEVEMQILPNVQITCEECGGKRFNDATLAIYFKGKNIYDVLDLSINEALVFFQNFPKIARPLTVLQEIGLGYVKLGQPSTTLSGGEAQRMKISTELRRPGTGKTLYLLDEPTTGLHFEDIRRLLECLQKLVDKGNSMVVIEHNLDVIKCADWVIDLGPEAGENGGYLVTEGTPEQVAKCKKSHTGRFLANKLCGGD
ncbi:MAG: excinuclease ABC subunit UvrA [Fibromonadaceae bacterium]|jgi:excinuclease ABC subunit A|nr:excinuclease ABC subunit UvrA [Fibromonadaceae bacterium]